MAKKIITEKHSTEKVEYKGEIPEGFVKCIFLKDYEDKKKGLVTSLVERRFKTLSNRGYVEKV